MPGIKDAEKFGLFIREAPDNVKCLPRSCKLADIGLPNPVTPFRSGFRQQCEQGNLEFAKLRKAAQSKVEAGGLPLLSEGGSYFGSDPKGLPLERDPDNKLSPPWSVLLTPPFSLRVPSILIRLKACLKAGARFTLLGGAEAPV